MEPTQGTLRSFASISSANRASGVLCKGPDAPQAASATMSSNSMAERMKLQTAAEI